MAVLNLAAKTGAGDNVSGREKLFGYYGLIAAATLMFLYILVAHLYLNRPVNRGFVMPAGVGFMVTVLAFRRSHPVYFAKTLQLRAFTGVAALLMLVDFLFSFQK